MIILDGEQGGEQWGLNRLGIATASSFNKVMTIKQHKRSKDVYIYELCAEAMTKESQATFSGNYDTESGTQQEPEAISWYEFEFNVDCESVGLCLPFEGAGYGASPDALVGSDGGVEAKCPQLKTHIKYLCQKNTVPDEHLHQVYGNLYVTGRDWWDFLSYHTDCPNQLVVRTKKTDPNYMKWAEAFNVVLREFLSDLEEIKLLTNKE